LNICILLATYNGATFLAQQLDSLISQTEKNWLCIIRDDGSKDQTVAIINEYCLKDSRISLLLDSLGSQGNAMANFSLLISEGMKTKANYFFFSDQDDVWMPNKIEVIYKQLTLYSEAIPLLIHHDLEVVNEKLSLLNPSFVKYAGLDPTSSFAQLLSKNVVTGCASACNRALLKESLPIPAEAMMHDWWLALIAAYKGQLVFLEVTLVKYRQHNNNVLGAQSFWQKLQPSKLRHNWQRQIRIFNSTTVQAKCFLLFDHVNVCNEKHNQLKTYSNINMVPRMRRIFMAKNMSFFPKNWLLKIIYVAKLFSL
jgi:rhamnosyltransferase